MIEKSEYPFLLLVEDNDSQPSRVAVKRVRAADEKAAVEQFYRAQRGRGSDVVIGVAYDFGTQWIWFDQVTLEQRPPEVVIGGDLRMSDLAMMV